ncbi:hypothetical protein [Nostoc sp. LPT]|uniref:hypothetical protein n=1 Tax=Nostoc sp. LPT TaxID=2815387 RepID=UPI0025DA41CC|nr:hypothetical protein [Nostoc sp. LPT]
MGKKPLNLKREQRDFLKSDIHRAMAAPTSSLPFGFCFAVRDAARSLLLRSR